MIPPAMKNLIAYFVVIPVETSAAVIAAALLLAITVTIVIALACIPARAADTPPPERSTDRSVERPTERSGGRPAERSTEKVLRDPTRPLASTAPRSGPVPPSAPRATAAPVVLPQLQLVLTATERRFAVIDGELLGVGDSIRGLAILEIHDEAVIVKTPNGPRTLPLSTGTENQGN